MARIKGVELRGYRFLHGKDRVGFLAFIFLNDKKIGSIIEPPTDEEVKLKISMKEDELILNQIAKEYYKEKPATLKGLIPFLKELSELTLLEKTLIKERRFGANSIVLLRYSRRTDRADEILNAPKERLIPLLKDVKLNEVIKRYKPVEYFVFSDTSDFIIK